MGELGWGVGVWVRYALGWWCAVGWRGVLWDAEVCCGMVRCAVEWRGVLWDGEVCCRMMGCHMRMRTLPDVYSVSFACPTHASVCELCRHAYYLPCTPDGADLHSVYTSLPPTPIFILPPIPLLSSRVLCTGHAGAIISGGKGGANDKVLCRETPQISTKG